MNKLMKCLLLIAGTAATVVASDHSATPSRCQCIVPKEAPPLEVAVEKAFQKSDVVFLGRVMSGRVAGDNLPGAQLEYTFAVTESWKGLDSTNVRIRTGMGGGDCGYDFKLGRSYLVYAYNGAPGSGPYEGKLITNFCTRTAPTGSSEARADVAILRGER